MDSIPLQRDQMTKYKKETYLNIRILSKISSLPPEVSKQILEEESFVKPTQNFFNHLSYYLISLVDKHKAKDLSWPLYDTKMERAYRNNISSFIAEYSSRGLLSPVMSSYLVNPSCFKVVTLVFQLSQLAVQKVLESKLKKPERLKLCKDMTDKYKSCNEKFMEDVETETCRELDSTSKVLNYIQKRKVMEELAEKLRDALVQVNKKHILGDAQKFINNLVDGFLHNRNFDKLTRNDILNLKNVDEQPNILESWLSNIEVSVLEMETEWIQVTKDLLEVSRSTMNSTKELISRHIGETDKSTYMVEYNHKTDEICIKELQNHVNAEQKFILRNTVKDKRLNFPNLIRSYVISISYILKGVEVGDQIYTFNEYFGVGATNMKDVALNMKLLLDRVKRANELSQPTSLAIDEPLLCLQSSLIPPLPDLYDLKTNNFQCQVLFETLTPLSTNKYRFKFSHERNKHLLVKPILKPIVTPFYRNIQIKEDFNASLISGRISAYDHPKNVCDDSMFPKFNETIADCQSGFTKDQIMRLLSTKKSSAKKPRNKTERNADSLKKGNLFIDSGILNESNRIFKSYSSPNLYEKIDKVAFHIRRKLSIMQEDNQSLSEVSGINSGEIDNGFATLTRPVIDSPRMLLDTSSLPVVTVEPPVNRKLSHIPIKIQRPQLEQKQDNVQKERSETPKISQPTKKTSSIEKIISRFKKVRASVIPMKNEEDFKIQEEVYTEDKWETKKSFTVNRILLPDLISPSCSVQSADSTDFFNNLDDFNERAYKGPRESLGTALGVDNTFLDQYDLID